MTRMELALSSRSLEEALEFLESVIPHLVHGKYGLTLYEYWVEEREAAAPGSNAILSEAARAALQSSKVGLVSSALQALAVTGDESDLLLIEPLLQHSDESVSQDAAVCVGYIRHRMKSIEQLLDEVKDRESFIVFALALAEERDRAEKFERENPDVYVVDGALGWMNGSIGQFIGAGLSHFEPAFGEKSIETPTWKDLAEFLYCGKTIE